MSAGHARARARQPREVGERGEHFVRREPHYSYAAGRWVRGLRHLELRH